MNFGRFSVLLLLLINHSLVEPVRAVDLAHGDIVTTVFGLDEGPTVMRIDPVTGDRTIISGAGIGTGIEFDGALGIAIADAQTVYVADRNLDAVIAVDTMSGNRTLVASDGVGFGPSLDVGEQQILSIAVHPQTGDIWATVPERQAVLRIDPIRGNRTEISSSSTGSGPGFVLPTDLEFTPDGQLFVVDQQESAVFQVDTVSGDRTVVARGFTTPTFMDIGPGGQIVIADWGLLDPETFQTVTPGRLFEVNPTAGSTSVLATGEFLDSLLDVAVGANGTLITTQPFDSEMYTVDVETGTPTILSSGPIPGLNNPIVGEGPDLNNALLLQVLLETSGLVGDLNGDNVVDAADIDFVCMAIRSGTLADVNGDGATSQADFDHLIDSVLNTRSGDTDLDGMVTFPDFLTMTSNFAQEGTWGQGDFDCSGNVDFPDFLALAGNFGFGVAAAAVPEPGGLGCWGLAGVGLLLWQSRSNGTVR